MKPLLFLLGLISVLPLAADDQDKWVKDLFGRKMVALRSPALDDRLSIGADGRYLKPVEPGGFGNGTILNIKSARIKDQTLELECRRVVLENKDKALETSQKAILKLELPSAITEGGIRALLSEIFLNEKELDQKAKDYWLQTATGREYENAKNSGDPIGMLEGKLVYAVTPKTVSPKPIYVPDPPYSENARRNRVQGEVGLFVVIDESGVPQVFRVQRSLGDLDLLAIDAVSRWRFKPATRNGMAIAVGVNVEIAFRLY